MKIEAFPGRHRVSAEEVRIVLKHAQQLTQREWAELFGIHLVTLQAWKAKGFILEMWSAPTVERWEGLKAEALRTLKANLAVLTASGSR